MPTTYKPRLHSGNEGITTDLSELRRSAALPYHDRRSTGDQCLLGNSVKIARCLIYVCTRLTDVLITGLGRLCCVSLGSIDIDAVSLADASLAILGSSSALDLSLAQLQNPHASRTHKRRSAIGNRRSKISFGRHI